MKTKKVALYVRVSTTSQTTDNQTIELRDYCKRQGWEIVKEYEDHAVSGAKHDRPALDAMLADAKRGRFDIVAVIRIDRLARSVTHLLEILTLLRASGVDFCSATQNIDTGTAHGKMVFTMIGAIAEFERELIRERIKSGLNRTRSEGTKLGRPRLGFDVTKAIELRDSGLGYKQIARQLNIPRTTLFRGLRGIPKSPAAVPA